MSPSHFPPPTRIPASRGREVRVDGNGAMSILLLLCVVLTSGCGASDDNATEEYDPTEILTRIFNPSNDTQLRAGYGLMNFEDQGLVNFDEGTPNNNIQPVKFEDNYIDEGIKLHNNIKKKRRRKQKQKRGPHVTPATGPYGPPATGPYVPPATGPYAGANPYYGEYNRPIPRPSPSIASQALASVTEALTSIAKYDDRQCVPRLLCESASGGALGSSQVLQTVAGLGPLMTLLSAYSGVSTNPLFVFGRAVLLGMSAKGPASCRYAYPLCPTDTEQLVHYLNNHNGGFFRFFKSSQQQQNLDQFYNGLPQGYEQPNQNTGQGSYGFYKPDLYSGDQGYGLAYPYNDHSKVKFKNKEKIEKRIQNKPVEDDDSKWKFPEIYEAFEYDVYNTQDDFENNFKFPKDKDNDRKTRGFSFPEQNYKYTNIENLHKFVFSNQNREIYNNDYITENYGHQGFNELGDGSQTVYVVRGNGDPNRPEIIRLKPGQSIKDAF